MKSPDSTFRLLVFDWDGTLMDSLGPIVACTLHVLEELGLEEPTREEIRGAIGLSQTQSLDRLFPWAGPEEREDLHGRMRRHWVETYHDRTVLFDGVPEMLRDLHGRGYFLAVATGKSRAGLDRDLAATGLGELFLATRTADDAASKPHPQMLLDVMDQLGAQTGETLMIGDTSFDLDMAKNARCAGLGVLTGSHGRETLAACDPLDVLEGAIHLPPWLADRQAGT